jgi:hypothetical protein
VTRTDIESESTAVIYLGPFRQHQIEDKSGQRKNRNALEELEVFAHLTPDFVFFGLIDTDDHSLVLRFVYPASEDMLSTHRWQEIIPQFLPSISCRLRSVLEQENTVKGQIWILFSSKVYLHHQRRSS